MDPQQSPPSARGTSTARRRSSVAYDPARDIFTEIPDTIAEEEAVASSPPSKGKTMSASPEIRKRQRSSSLVVNGGIPETVITEPPAKRQKSEEPVAGQRNGHTIPPSNESPVNGHTTSSRVPRIPSADIPERKPAERSQAAYSNRRPENGQRPRQRPDDERPRDFDRVREKPRRRSRSPANRVPSAYRRRSPPRQQRRDPSPSEIFNRDPSPIPDSPPRNTGQRPAGRGRGRNVQAELDALRASREGGRGGPVGHGVQGVVNQHYNQVPEYVKERGRDWRRNESQIKGLRSFNNWVKSCIIQKFSPTEKAVEQEEELGWGETAKEPEEIKPLLVLDIGCGKGGDLQKWSKAPQQLALYVGLDPAEISVNQARDRYKEMWRGRRPRFDGQFGVKDCFGEWIGDVPIVKEVGIDPTPNTMNRWGKGGGFDIVTMMFTMHYSFECEEKVNMMLRNVSGALKKGGRLIGVCPNSDVISGGVKNWFQKNPDKYKVQPPMDDNEQEQESNGADSEGPSWSNSIYSVKFPPPQPNGPTLNSDGSFRPPFSHKYMYYIAEAVDTPEFVVPWEAFRAMAENYGLEQRYRKGFLDIWHCETDPERATNTGGATSNANSGGWGQEVSYDEQEKDATAAVARELQQLGVRMGVVKYPGGPLLMSEEEKEAVSFYHGFCFVKS